MDGTEGCSSRGRAGAAVSVNGMVTSSVVAVAGVGTGVVAGIVARVAGALHCVGKNPGSKGDSNCAPPQPSRRVSEVDPEINPGSRGPETGSSASENGSGGCCPRKQHPGGEGSAFKVSRLGSSRCDERGVCSGVATAKVLATVDSEGVE